MPDSQPIQFEALLTALSDHGVRYIIVGGVAGVIHGAVRLTQDLDIVYERSPANIEKLVEALANHRPYIRGAPPNLPFVWDRKTIQSGLNFTLTTDLGPIDLLGEMLGVGTFEDVLPHTEDVELFGHACRVIDLATLIRAKRAAGRPRDLEVIAELEALSEERGDD